MPTTEELFKSSALYTDEKIYTIVKLPARAVTAAAGVVAEVAAPFSALIVDKDEVSLLIDIEMWEDFQNRLPGAQTEGKFRLITFETVLEFDVTGFMALVSGILAAHGIPILSFAAFSRDHLFVPADKFAIAWDVLESSQKELR
ncbi:MAG: ACT domain-containing protein [Chloroflexi bacterium]|nr:ACT domain-containing protein [Chloroflexota bacterium]